MRLHLALIPLLAGCADAPPAEPTLTVRAIYLESMYDGQAMNVEHEAIPDRMPAMEMPFRVKDPAILDGLVEGGPVRLTLDSASLAVVAIEPLPESTQLDFDSNGGRDSVFVPSEL